jgi:hypothetical protein
MEKSTWSSLVHKDAIIWFRDCVFTGRVIVYKSPPSVPPVLREQQVFFYTILSPLHAARVNVHTLGVLKIKIQLQNGKKRIQGAAT